MSDDQFMVNAESAYQNKPHNLSNKQMSFVQDALTCYQLIGIMEKMEQEVAGISK